ncbi:archaellin/type IV pilin N-terminal domain-containing protein [Haloarchaeobius iranensis]|uniref:Flagellin n=1 Tax=Haloarchaeobius iranensis TaxID=996166 RepID=A0A1G9ZFX6_9EURY|nr:archaellin/type IV pilin N-terminal domain-containing protein [Haloarchaeobius iranensis]SDN20330.1 flagellin FlaB [Haloarchaeobius iranensis]
MFADITENDGDRGQVGIGTLIIFIAMVLVAAVAAGVLINTAGLLESTASDTGQDSQAQVSNQIEVVSASGNVSGSQTVQYLNFTVKKSAGSDDLDLEDATVEVTTDEISETLTFDTAAAGYGNGNFTVANTDETSAYLANTSDVVLSETSERKVIGIYMGSSALGDELEEGEEATVRFVDQSGATTIYGVNVPDTISSDQDYVAV